MTDDIDLALTDAPPADMRDVLGRRLGAFNVEVLGPADSKPLAITIRSKGDGALIGGLFGRTGFRRMFIELLFIPDGLRGQGIGPKLLQQAEDEAKRRNCLGAWLETLNADAMRVYVRSGYRVFGEIPDYPPGNTRYFLSKDF